VTWPDKSKFGTWIGTSRSLQVPSSKYSPYGGPHCFRSHRPVSASQTQSENSRFRSGKSGSSLTRKPKRSQSSSPGHLPVHACRRGSSPWKCAQPNACHPQCGQRSTSQPSRWRSPMGVPQSGHGLSCLLNGFFQRASGTTVSLGGLTSNTADANSMRFCSFIPSKP